MNFLLLKPKPGRRVLDPSQSPPSPLPPEGRKVEDTPYWRRKLRERVVVRVEAIVNQEFEAAVAAAEDGRADGSVRRERSGYARTREIIRSAPTEAEPAAEPKQSKGK